MSNDTSERMNRFYVWRDDTKRFIARILGIEVSRDTTEDFALAITPELENLREALLHATELLRLSGKYVDWKAVHEQWDIEGRIPMPIKQAHTNILEAASSDLDLASKADTRSCVFFFVNQSCAVSSTALQHAFGRWCFYIHQSSAISTARLHNNHERQSIQRPGTVGTRVPHRRSRESLLFPLRRYL